MIKLLHYLRGFLDATDNHSGLPSLWLNRHLSHLSIATEVSLKNRRGEGQPFFPSHLDRTQFFIKLFGIHLILYFSPQVLPVFLLLFHALEELFPPSQLCSQIFFPLSFFFLPSLQVLNEYLSLLIHPLNSFLFFSHGLYMNRIELPVLLLLQKLIGPAYLNEYLCGLFIFVSVGVILQGKGAILLLDLSEIFCGFAFQKLIRVFFQLQLLQSLLESLHLLQVLYSELIMALNQWYNGVVSYWWPNPNAQQSLQQQENEGMSVLSRLKRLRNLMKDSNYSQQSTQQICNFYSKIIKEYPQAKSTFKYPNFLYEPQIYTPKICFQIELRINLHDLKGALELFVMFPEELASEMPAFFIKNPNYTLFKPNKKYVIFGSKSHQERFYQAVMGGVKVLMPVSSNERWQWTSTQYYKEQNVLNMVRWIHKQLILDYFPFVKRKKQKYDLIQDQAKRLRQYIGKTLKPSEGTIEEAPLLKNIQDLCALQESITLQITIIHQEIENLKLIQIESTSWNVKEFLPAPSDRRSDILLESASSLEALKDTVCFLEHRLYTNELSLGQFQRLSQSIFRQEFDERRRISLWQVPQIL